jgi:hypothetical protein
VARTVRRGGHEPTVLSSVIGALVTERAWELPAAGATLRAVGGHRPRVRGARRRRGVRPEPNTTPDDTPPASIEQARTERRRQADASHTAALGKAHAERAARPARTPAAIPQTALLGRTA